MLSFPMEAHGFGAVLATQRRARRGMQELMSKMKKMTAQPLSSYSDEWKTLPQQLVDIAADQSRALRRKAWSKFRAAIYVFQVEGIEIEGSTTSAWMFNIRGKIRRGASTTIGCISKTFYIDKYPVTNAQFKKFLDATHYHPNDDLNFLRDWKNGTYPEGWANKPVTWVSLEDARAYAPGRANGCRTSGSGNMPRKAPMDAVSRGATIGMPRSAPARQGPYDART